METRSPSEIGKRHRREVDVAIGKSIILVEGAEEGGELNGKLLWHLEVRHPRCVVEKQEQVIGTYVCSQKHNYIPYITFATTTVQLHVSAINVGHLQVVHEAPYDKLYLHLVGRVA